MKKIVLGITGGIAAYKCPQLVRLLQQQGCEVRCVLTAAAQQFVTPFTLQVLSKNPVISELFDLDQEQQMSHIAVARWADEIIIAPASANFIAKLANGLADDLLTTLCLATTATITLAPAMNSKMWHHPATQHNLTLLKQRGVKIIEPEFGEQACGEVGVGRMALLDTIVTSLDNKNKKFSGKKVVITAGPTREAIDPVRYISNRSSGKMGFAMAHALAQLGAQVILITGPVNLATPMNVQRVDVVSAEQMYQAVMANIIDCAIFISVAAVADYRLAQPTAHKIKKTQSALTLELVKNRDILAAVGALATKPFVIGFAAETENLEINAKEKLIEKNCDMVVANLVGEQQAFDQDENTVLLLSKSAPTLSLAGTKAAIADKIAAYVELSDSSIA